MTIDPERLRTWVADQLEERRPTGELDGAGASIQEVASAVSALESGHGPVFGMMVDGDGHSAIVSLATRGREVIASWISALRDTHGDEGVAMVTTIARRAGLTLAAGHAKPEAKPAPADPQLDAAMSALERMLGDSDELTRFWRADDRAEAGEIVVARVGVPDPAKLDEHAAAFEADSDSELPANYLAFMRRFDGLVVYTLDEGPAPFQRVPGDELSEPLIWPTDTYGDHLQLMDVDLEGIASAYVFGEIADGGMFVFDVTPEAPVFWVPRTFSREPPTRIARTFGEFVTMVTEARACGPAVLRKARVPGWGA